MDIEIIASIAAAGAAGVGFLAGRFKKASPVAERERPAPSARTLKPPRATEDHVHEWTWVDVYGWHCSGCDEVWKRPKERTN